LDQAVTPRPDVHVLRLVDSPHSAIDEAKEAGNAGSRSCTDFVAEEGNTNHATAWPAQAASVIAVPRMRTSYVLLCSDGLSDALEQSEVRGVSSLAPLVVSWPWGC
jgi:serine/threonine protein phosphatase PrpC